MQGQGQDRHVEVVQDGQVVAAADVHPVGTATVRAELHVESGHHATGVGAELVDAVLDLDEAKAGSLLEATLPAGEVDSLDRLRARCDSVETRPAGSTCLVDASLPAADPEAG